jgi:Rrf2 family protein
MRRCSWGILLGVSDAASLGLHAVALIAYPRRGGALTARAIAEQLGASDAYLSKMLRRLAKSGLLGSRRGPGGGFFLRCDPTKVSLLEVVDCLEPRGPRHRSTSRHRCLLRGCLLGPLFARTNDQASTFMATHHLSDMVGRRARTARGRARGTVGA